MQAVHAKLLTLFDGRKQFIIPIYQRTYSWSEKQCRQLWVDIVRTAQDKNIPAHFIGSVVYIRASLYDTPTTSTAQMLVIDGQQRLTTLFLLLIALREALKTGGISAEITAEELDDYLINKHGKGELRHKLVLTQADKDTLAALIDGRLMPTKPSLHVVQNLSFFKSQIHSSALSIDTILLGVQKLMMVDISLDRSHDNPQLIFESLNSTGLDLSQADLIRNFVLMGLEPNQQTDLYQHYWYPMEQSFGHADTSGLFDRFMRDYLTIKMGRIPNMDQVYTEFKTWVQADGDSRSIAEVVADIYRFSRYYVRIALHKDPDPVLNRHFVDINKLRMEVAYPFLVEVYQDYENQVIKRDKFTKILSLVESYVFRRAICGIPTNSLNKTFAGFSRELHKDDYVDSFQAILLAKDSYRRFPSDEEFMREFVVKDVYNFRSRNYYLAKLENYERKEPVPVESYTIEHILPQNPHLRPEWQAALGADWKAIQSRLLNTLGNLTLTGYNSEYSDRPFPRKRDMDGGFAQSPLLLNKGLGQLDNWGEVQILARAKELSQKAINVWPYPDLPPEALARYEPLPLADDATAYKSVDHAEYLQGDMLLLFQEFRKRVLNLDVSVRQEVKKLYIAYKNTTNFVDVIPQKSGLLLTLNIQFNEIDDPKGLCRDITNIGRWGNGDVEVRLSSLDQLEDVMVLVGQAFDKHLEDTD